jgi:prepilin-type N-terminal cleavage/methylation domain-containing protein
MNSHRHAFTLIELLVVIAIIGILAGLLFPAVNGAIDGARKAQAKNDVVQIATAVTAYEAEYGRLPGAGASDITQDVNKDLVDTLSGISTKDNPRKIVFIEVQERKPDIVGKGGKSGTNSSGFVDPWGGKYVVRLDLDYDNSLSSVGASPGPTAPLVRKKVAVWNIPQGKDDSQKKRRAVGSWE